MAEMAVLAYGALASFVLACASRNRRQARANPAILIHFGWGLAGFSGAFGLILLAYAGCTVLGIA